MQTLVLFLLSSCVLLTGEPSSPLTPLGSEQKDPKEQTIQAKPSEEKSSSISPDKETADTPNLLSSSEVKTPSEVSGVKGSDENISSQTSEANTEDLGNSLISSFEIPNEKSVKTIANNAEQPEASKESTPSGKECNPELLGAFGIMSKIVKPFKATRKEQNYCKRNTLTCCDHNHFASVSASFQRAGREFKARFEALEELLGLFRGGVFKSFMVEVYRNEDCHFVTDDVTDNEGNRIFFTEEYYSSIIEEIEFLLIELEAYQKRVLWLQGNMFCTICNPFNQKFFVFTDGGAEVLGNESVCQELFENYEIEVRLMKLFNGPILKVVDLAKCHARTTGDAEMAVEGLNEGQINNFERLLKECLAGSSFVEDECAAICASKNIGIYKFPLEFFGNVKQALNVLFNKFADQDIEEYYRRVKKQEFKTGREDQPIIFYERAQGLKKKDDYRNLAWVFSAESGISVFNDYMSKKMLSFKTEKIVAAVLVIAFAFVM